MPVVLKKLAYLEIGVNQDGSSDSMSHLSRSRRDCSYHGRAMLDDEGSAKQTMALPGEGVEGVNFIPV